MNVIQKMTVEEHADHVAELMHSGSPHLQDALSLHGLVMEGKVAAIRGKDGQVRYRAITRKGNPQSADKLIKKCRALYMAYYNKPTKTNLKKLSDFLDVMKENKSKKVKDERKKAMSFVRRENSYFKKGKKAR